MKAPTNKRKERRRARHHEAWVFTSAGSRHCTVVNISENGATLSVQDEMPLPREFELAFSLNRIKAKNCKLVWSRGATAGVKFVP
jgi:PilZ domain-containing protein